MQIGLPSSYPSACSLPFNTASLEQSFQLASPDRDCGGEGFWLILAGTKVLTTPDLQLPAGLNPFPDNEQAPLYIGKWQDRPCRMLILKDTESISSAFLTHSLHARDPQIPLPALSLAGIGLMINHWEESSRFCGYCGTPLTRLPNEWGKQCRECNNHHFPRIHPCVIGLVVKGDEILLVRKPEWEDGRFGLVAGFVEFGESLEEAMAREVKEETGIEVKNIRYIGSQCWPFPSQIMNGFVADYRSGEITLQQDELADGGWFTLDQLPTIPPRRSIARYLIDRAAEFIAEKTNI